MALRDGVFNSWKSDVGEQQHRLLHPVWACVSASFEEAWGTFSEDEVVSAIEGDGVLVWQGSWDTVGILNKLLNGQQRILLGTSFKYMYLVIC